MVADERRVASVGKKQRLGYVVRTVQGAGETQNSSHFSIRIADDWASRKRASDLVRKTYSENGLLNGLPEQTRDEDRLTLLAEDCDGQAVATISLAFDTGSGLPCDEIYAEDLQPLRALDRGLIEVVSFAIDRSRCCSRMIMVCLFNLIYIYARKINCCDEIVIEVAPRHMGYFEQCFGFVPLGDPCPCPRVGDAKAVLLRLDLDIPFQGVLRWAGKG